ncbi:uncharacterized protein V6R79_018139 [Siganus canaliculatus]
MRTRSSSEAARYGAAFRSQPGPLQKELRSDPSLDLCRRSCAQIPAVDFCRRSCAQIPAVDLCRRSCAVCPCAASSGCGYGATGSGTGTGKQPPLKVEPRGTKFSQ